MILKLEIVKVNPDYCDYLRKYDDKVVYNRSQKQTRPFVGVLFRIDECEYFAPLSSPKVKHLKMKNKLDFFKIKNGELGAINFNNMIPVMKNNYSLVDLEDNAKSDFDTRYKKLLQKQLDWLNANLIQLKNKSSKLYHLYINDKLPDNIKNRCCDFKLLEEKCAEYNSVKL